MFANWIQIAELVLLPLGLAVGYGAGRVCRRDERESFRSRASVTHPGLVREYRYPLDVPDGYENYPGGQ